MKIAAVTDDGQKISPHFGRAEQYVVCTVEDGVIVARELRAKAGHNEFAREGTPHHEHHDDDHGHGHGRHNAEKHRRMFATIADCAVVLSRGMGQGAYSGLAEMGVEPILTDIADIDVAIQAVLDGSIVNHKERLH